MIRQRGCDDRPRSVPGSPTFHPSACSGSTAERTLKEEVQHHNVAAAVEGGLVFVVSIHSAYFLCSVIMRQIYFNEEGGLNKCHLCRHFLLSLPSEDILDDALSK